MFLLGWLVLLLVGRGVSRVVMVVTMFLRSRMSWDVILPIVRINYRLSGGIGLLYRRDIGFGNCFMLIGITFGGLAFVFLGEIQLDRVYLSSLVGCWHWLICLLLIYPGYPILYIIRYLALREVMFFRYNIYHSISKSVTSKELQVESQ